MAIPHDAVVFDCDGTLVGTERAWNRAYRLLFAHHQVPLTPQARAQLVGLQLTELGQVLADMLGYPAPPDQLGRRVYDLVRTNLGAGVYARTGAVELVSALHGTQAMAIATNTPTAIVRDHLAAAGVPNAFDAIVDSAVAGAPKPAPHPYGHACALLGVDPGKAIAIEDSATGVASARAAGLYVIGVPSHPDVPLDDDLRAHDLLDPRIWTTLNLTTIGASHETPARPYA